MHKIYICTKKIHYSHETLLYALVMKFHYKRDKPIVKKNREYFFNAGYLTTNIS